MVNLMSQVSSVFNPKPPEIKNYHAAIKSVNTQETARITKIALYVFTVIVTSATFALMEASLVAWPLCMVGFGVALVAGAIFARLNVLSSRYTEWITDDLRSTYVKDEVERIFHTHHNMGTEQLTKALKDINRLVGTDLFNKEHIRTIIAVNRESATSEEAMTLAETIQKQGIPVNFSSSHKRKTDGEFGLTVMQYSFNFTCSLIPGETTFTFQSEEKTDTPAAAED